MHDTEVGVMNLGVNGYRLAGDTLTATTIKSPPHVTALFGRDSGDLLQLLNGLILLLLLGLTFVGLYLILPS